MICARPQSTEQLCGRLYIAVHVRIALSCLHTKQMNHNCTSNMSAVAVHKIGNNKMQRWLDGSD